ncbi:VIT1/CCC1 transporter family protein [Pseudoxanthomonas wuyuanensis]|uniref:Predicted Fe2+/Mn2+ transporter, VIT1/CCC1 family n=1 Tax=Pseudoxanthomonas wuyuanensis TaxID=1073196 RepID=A0A286CYK3_9GAMM|nr:VIT family protein [Pseudoxanthomonas wuyuanensis]KAF1722752.1 VIT family protein [Pseudoxanthomonas wuyuanensis]SOD51477.1 Predicted Fe2+/Mn2+ transporter, VIT1/CCC1 family [Pseudoxanthomonas wuyuanensis]
MRHTERHRNQRIGWLRAAVLGANDGLISTSSLIVGVSAADASVRSVLLAGLAGLVAGSLSMAAGEYVSVSSQSDTERADTEKERRELATQPEAELQELAGIYEKRGLSPSLALDVAKELTAADPLGAHLRDELGIHEATQARPLQAALASAGSFCVGAAPPLLVAAFWTGSVTLVIALVSLLLLAILGGAAARMGGASIVRGALRVMVWGALAMAITAGIGKLFGTAGLA